tara:strand:- start:7848 stop:8390 length:543 start_codon:yes stop_codon:yes gene_type:complete
MPAETSSEVYWYLINSGGDSATALPASRFTVERRQEVRRRAVRGPGGKSSYVLGDGMKEPFLVALRWLNSSDDNLDAWGDSDTLNASVTSATRLVKCANTSTILDSSGSAITDADGDTLFESVGHSIELHGLTNFSNSEAGDGFSEINRFYSAEFLSKFGAPIEGSADSSWAYDNFQETG